MAWENYLIQSIEAENTLFECQPSKSNDCPFTIHLLLFVDAICYLGCIVDCLACYFESCWLSAHQDQMKLQQLHFHDFNLLASWMGISVRTGCRLTLSTCLHHGRSSGRSWRLSRRGRKLGDLFLIYSYLLSGENGESNVNLSFWPLVAIGHRTVNKISVVLLFWQDFNWGN